MTTQSVLAEVGAERTRQDAQWGGEERDDALPLASFVQLIGDYAAWARVKAREGSNVEARQRLVQVAALAVAAVEALDRRGSARAEGTPSGENAKVAGEGSAPRSGGLSWE
ncbi:hypothetical protein [Falsiroseomonas sp.]|uniref:hypothetical protein n=1 Tax=Falsiroseomonas sp. TaxID=2870721 RepID=UPI0027273FA3|nr:hypothetical protein [Falsiroseomonas sp.]MDO9498700.1 hypothetical protein [Falsiroseomonas sp.]MDP3416535.1 hypothetical protein [Falsiroseomonas sp.]